jgi:hypothetical protein
LDQSKFDPTSFLGPKAQIQTYKTSPNPNFFIHSFQFSVFNFFSSSQGCCRPTHDIITIVEPSIKEGICEKHLIFFFSCLFELYICVIYFKEIFATFSLATSDLSISLAFFLSLLILNKIVFYLFIDLRCLNDNFSRMIFVFGFL